MRAISRSNCPRRSSGGVDVVGTEEIGCHPSFGGDLVETPLFLFGGEGVVIMTRIGGVELVGWSRPGRAGTAEVVFLVRGARRPPRRVGAISWKAHAL